MNGIIRCETPQDYNDVFGLETLHPLVAVIDYSKLRSIDLPEGWSYGFYGIYLKGAGQCALRYGRNYYDYKEGTLMFTAPNQAITLTKEDRDTPLEPNNRALFFHPDIIRGTSLGKNIKDYTFFSYDVHEALHLAESERQMVIDCFRNIEYELNRGIDKHSKTLIVSNVELFLNYCVRFYDRQFITRQNANIDILSKFELLLNNYFQSDLPKTLGLPSVKYCAEQLNISANYFGDLLKKETGKNAQEHIQLKLIEAAKEKLFQKDKTVSEIAYELGFEYPQYFSRIFKKKVGVTPNEYRIAN